MDSSSNSQKIFCQKAALLVKKEFTVQELEETLSLFDELLVKEAHVENKLLVRLGFSSFRFARRLFLYDLFYRMARKHADFFDEAPSEFLQAYNKIVDAVFSASRAKKLHAKRKSKALMRRKLSLPKRVEALCLFQDLYTAAKQSPHALESMEKSYDTRMQKIEMLEKRIDALKKTCATLDIEIPDVFDTSAQRQAENTLWQERIDALTHLALDLPQTFESKEAFSVFLAQKDEELENVQYLSKAFIVAKHIKKALETFCQKTKPVLPFLYKAYVEEFLSEMERKVLCCTESTETEQTLCSMLEVQKAHLLALNDEVDKGYAEMRNRVFSHIQRRLTQGRVLAKDIRAQAEAIVGADFYDSLPKKRVLSEEIVSQIQKEMQLFFSHQEQKILNLEKKAIRRNEQIQEIEFFQKDYMQLMTPLKQFKDFHQTHDPFTEEVMKLPITKREMQLAKPDDLQTLIDDRYALKESMQERVHEKSQMMQKACQSLEMRLQDAKQTIRRRIVEVFTGISAYQDLSETYIALRNELNRTLTALVDDFYSGKITVHDFVSSCEDLAYLHDVVKLRNEISHRSARLKDLRDEAYRLFQSLQHHRRLLECNPIIAQEKIYRDFLFMLRALRQVMNQIENPFEAFSDATNKDEVNFVFRSMWMKIEELQPKIEVLIDEAKKRLQSKPEYFKKQFLKAVDTLEEVVKSYEGARPILVVKIENELQTQSRSDIVQTLERKIQELEALYPFIKPFSFYVQIQDYKLCKNLLKSAKELQDTIDTTRLFAKSMQYIKTFEEERVDVILEGFERTFIFEEEESQDAVVESAFSAYETRMLITAALIIEEVLLDIGLLDLHALMDVDPKKLKKILRLAILKASTYYASEDFGLEKKCMQLQAFDKSPYSNQSGFFLCQKSYEHLKARLQGWKQKAPDADAPLDMLLEHLRHLCHELFDVKIMLAACQNNHIAKTFAIISDLRTLSRVVQTWLETDRGKKSGLWGAPWIPECLAIRHEIERFNPETFTSAEFRPLVAKVFDQIYAISEIGDARGKGQDPLQLQACAEELDAHLEELDALAKDAKREFPFFYSPGFLRFFLDA